MQFYIGIIIVLFILLGYVLLLKDKFKYNMIYRLDAVDAYNL